MTLDIRTRLSALINNADIGVPVLSFQCSDSALPGAGLIFTRGTLELLGQVGLTCGVEVRLKYADGPATVEIPRSLFALGSTYSPIADITTVEVGCKLTLQRNTIEEKVLTADMTLVNSDDYTESDQKIVTVPIFVNDILDFCASSIGLFNTLRVDAQDAFSVPYFDLSPGYVNILNDLCLSYGIPAYADGGLLLFAVSNNIYRVNRTLIDLAPLSIGEPVPGEYKVKYNYQTLKESEAPDPEKLNWEKQESYGLPTTVTIDNPVEPFVGGTTVWNVPDSFQYTYTPYTLIETAYDAYDRVVTRVTKERSVVAAIAPSYVQHIAGKYIDSSVGAGGTTTYTQRTPPEGSLQVETFKTESITYKVKAPSIFQGSSYPEGYEIVEREETVDEEPLLQLTASTPVYSYAGQANVEYTYGSNPSLRFVARRDIRTVETSNGSQGQQLSKTLTEQYLCQAYTQEGQQILADALQKIGQRSPFDAATADALFENARSIKRLGTVVEISSGREVGLQQRPPQAERTNSAYSAERVNRSITGTAGGIAGTRTYTLPYAPDDIFAKDVNGNYFVIKESNAYRYATNFGKTQSKYDYGIRSGVNIKAGLRGFPSSPCPRMFVSLPKGDAGGYGQVQSVSFTFDQSGGIVSADVLGVGVISSNTKQLFASRVTYQPPNPVVQAQAPDSILGTVATVGANAQLTLNTAFPARTIGDGIQALDTGRFWLYDFVSGAGTWVDVGTNPADVLTQYSVVPLYSSRDNVDFGTTTRIKVQSLPYALSLLTTLALTTKTAVEIRKVLIVNIPLSTVALAAPAPAVALGAAVAVPTSSVALAAAAPAVSVSTVIAVPLTDLAVAALTPAQAGADGATVTVPLTSIGLSAQVPEGIGADLETFYNSWRLQVYGTDAWVLPDWWAD